MTKSAKMHSGGGTEVVFALLVVVGVLVFLAGAPVGKRPSKLKLRDTADNPDLETVGESQISQIIACEELRISTARLVLKSHPSHQF